MTPDDLAADLELAHRLADEARSISLVMFRSNFGQRLKADGSVVTDADEAIERAIRDRLGTERPGDAMLGEEFGETGTGPRRWIVDAIDGTASFACGSDYWGTLIALEVEGQVVVGVCDMAPKNRRYFAGLGMGAYLAHGNGEPGRLGVSQSRTVAGSRCFVPGHEWVPLEDRQRGKALRERMHSPEPHDHPALLVATGELEAAVFFRAGPWDVAAPSLVVAEAGGRFTDLQGGPSLMNDGAAFSNGHLHDDVLGLVGRPGPRPG